MFKLNSFQLLASVSAVLVLLLIINRLLFIAGAEESVAYRDVERRMTLHFIFTYNDKEIRFEANEFTSGKFVYGEPVPVLFDADEPENARINSFSGIWGEHIFWHSIIIFAWIMGGSAILAHNEQLLIGKGWLKAKKTKTGTPPETSRLPAVRKKSRNFKNE